MDRGVRAIRVAGHQGLEVRVEGEPGPGGARPVTAQLRGPFVEPLGVVRCVRVDGPGGGRLDQCGTDEQVDRHVLAGVDAGPEVAPPGRERIRPGDHGVGRPTDVLDLELAPPAVVVERPHRCLDPARRPGPSMPEPHRHDVVAVGECVRLDDHRVADGALDREPATIDLRGHGLDDRSPASIPHRTGLVGHASIPLTC